MPIAQPVNQTEGGSSIELPASQSSWYPTPRLIASSKVFTVWLRQFIFEVYLIPISFAKTGHKAFLKAVTTIRCFIHSISSFAGFMEFKPLSATPSLPLGLQNMPVCDEAFLDRNLCTPGGSLLLPDGSSKIVIIAFPVVWCDRTEQVKLLRPFQCTCYNSYEFEEMNLKCVFLLSWFARNEKCKKQLDYRALPAMPQMPSTEQNWIGTDILLFPIQNEWMPCVSVVNMYFPHNFNQLCLFFSIIDSFFEAFIYSFSQP